MPISTKLEKNLITPVSDRITNVEQVNFTQSTAITNNTNNITINTNAIANINNNTAGYQTASQVNTAVNILKGNPPTAFNTLEKIATTIPYIGAAPYPYALVLGNQWIEYDTNTNYLETWFWNGNYWLSVDKISINYSANVALTNLYFFPQPQIDTSTSIINTNIFLLNLKISFYLTALSDASNNWKLQFHSVTSTGTYNQISSDNLTPVTANIPETITRIFNSHLDFSATGTKFLRLSALKTGSPVAINTSALLTYKRARI